MIVDAGPLVATADVRDRWHRQCADLLNEIDEPLIVPELVVCEVAYLLARRIGVEAEVAFGRAIAAGELRVEPPLPSEWPRITELANAYRDVGLGLVDASLVVLAERLNEDRVATLDRRHLTAVRPAHVAALQLLPDVRTD